MELLKWMVFFFSSYYVLLSVFLILKMAIQLKRVMILQAKGHDVPVFTNRACVPISIIVPIKSDEKELVTYLSMLLSFTYPSYEIVLVYDETDEMLLSHITKTYGLEKMQHPYRNRFATERILNIYEGMSEHVGITLVQKEKSSVRDAYHAGINLSKYPYVILLDEDIEMTKDALSQMIYQMLRSSSMVASRGRMSLKKKESTFDYFNFFYYRKAVMSYSKRVRDEGEKSLWLLKKEMIFTLNGLQEDETISHFMARFYEYCWDHEMEDAIAIMPSTVGFYRTFPSLLEYLLFSPFFLIKFCMIFLGFFFFLFAVSFQLFSPIIFLLFWFYLMIEGFISWIIYFKMKE